LGNDFPFGRRPFAGGVLEGDRHASPETQNRSENCQESYDGSGR
jgi:hypothetical protein